MNVGLSRTLNPLTASLNTAVGTTEAIPFQDASGGAVQVPTGSSITTLTYWGSADGVTYVALYDRNNVAVTQTVAAARVYPLPDECFGLHSIKIVVNAAGDVLISRKG